MTRAAFEAQQVDSRIERFQLLVPVGLMAIAEELNQEEERLAGPRYARLSGENKGYRHGTNPGTVKFLGQSVPMEFSRVRSNGKELPLTTYQQAHRGLVMNADLFRKVLYGISCRDFEAAATPIPGCPSRRSCARLWRRAPGNCGSFWIETSAAMTSSPSSSTARRSPRT